MTIIWKHLETFGNIWKHIWKQSAMILGRKRPIYLAVKNVIIIHRKEAIKFAMYQPINAKTMIWQRLAMIWAEKGRKGSKRDTPI